MFKRNIFRLPKISRLLKMVTTLKSTIVFFVHLLVYKLNNYLYIAGLNKYLGPFYWFSLAQYSFFYSFSVCKL